MSYIRCNNIYKRYRDKQVLNGLSFECENEIAFLAGKNGAGKTTFIRIALGMDNATSGNIDFSHDGISGESRGAVFDTPCLYPFSAACMVFAAYIALSLASVIVLSRFQKNS